ncbi:MAG: ABC transporter substrate-binding protein [Acidobacteria bacterium]|nr:ABC transporter substrate-binding protein [Acidobacteriota bacterium]
MSVTEYLPAVPKPGQKSSFRQLWKGVFAFLIPTVFLACTSVPPPETLVQIGGFSREPASLIAENKAFLQEEGIRMTYTRVNSSFELMQGFVDGQFDVIHTNADNVIAWAEGQGLDQTPHDFIIFMGGRKGLLQRLVVGPEIESFDDLKGKTLAVDAYNTGYAPVLVYMLKQEGLTLEQDYEMKTVGGGRLRREAVKRGEAVGGFMSLDEELEQRGFYLLAQSDAYITSYARGVGAARRDWAEQNEDLLVRYIRAMARATDWLMDPQNKQEAIQVFREANPDAPEEAEEYYEESVHPDFGVMPRGEVDREGIQTILEIREVMGEMEAPLPSPDKYVEESYHRKAMASLGGR